MKPVIGLLLGFVLLSGCVSLGRYEYRYRVFYGVNLEGKQSLTTEEFSKLFYPVGSLNRAMDLFGEEGFELYDYQQLGSGHNYIFKFRRSIKQTRGKPLPMRHMYGIYRIQKDDREILIAIVPTDEGIEVIDIEGVRNRYPAYLEEGKVVYQMGEGQAAVSVSEDGMAELNLRNIKDNTTVIKNYKGRKEQK